MTHANTTPRRSHRARRGITLVELIVVISIILLLVGLITVGYSTVVQSARTAKNTAFVQSVGQGVEAFRADFANRLPPLVLDLPRGGSALGSAGQGAFVVADQFDDVTERAQRIRDARYNSEFTLGIYLLGTSDLNGDGQLNYTEQGAADVAFNEDDGLDGPGFRDPGPILAWKRRDARSSQNPRPWIHEPAQTGRTYGPYLEPGNDEFIRTVTNEGASVQQLVDSFGNPIRFYSGYLTIDPAKGTKSSFFAPPELMSSEAAKLFSNNSDPFPLGDDDFEQNFHAKNREMLNADYVILAANADPDNFRTNTGEIQPFGDVLSLSNGSQRRIDLLGTVSTPIPWSEGSFNDAGDVALDRWVEMIDSNLRYTP